MHEFRADFAWLLQLNVKMSFLLQGCKHDNCTVFRRSMCTVLSTSRKVQYTYFLKRVQDRKDQKQTKTIFRTNSSIKDF